MSADAGPIPFDAIASAVGDTPFMTRAQGRTVYDHVRSTRPQLILELGTAHGVGAAYMAGALEPDGRLITVDHMDSTFDPGPRAVLERAGVSDRVDVVRKFSSYNWWLKEEIERGEPRFDFVYLDGAKNWTIDGLAVLLIEKVLRPGGWLLMDDLGWTYASKRLDTISDGVTIRGLSEEERAEPHLRAVFRLLVEPHPSFVEMKIEDDWWGWARKRADSDSGAKTLEITVSRTLGVRVTSALTRLVRAARITLARRRTS
jgi:predicted O-methyltransferase YrrM